MYRYMYVEDQFARVLNPSIQISPSSPVPPAVPSPSGFTDIYMHLGWLCSIPHVPKETLIINYIPSNIEFQPNYSLIVPV